MIEETPSDSHQNESRIRILRFLCFLTFLWSGLNGVVQGIIGLFYVYFIAVTPESFQDIQLTEDQITMINEGMSLIRTGGRPYFILNSLLFGASFLGAIRMWQLRKFGFHLYSVSQILMLILPLVFITGFNMPGINIFLTAVFILAYSGFYKYMK